MATRIETILTRVRDTLADPKKERYTDDQLLRLVDEAQKVIAEKAELLRRKEIISLEPFKAEYSLPGYAHTINRALDNNQESVPIISHAFADHNYGLEWETEEGEDLVAIVYDKNELGSFKVYPIPNTGVLSENEYIAANAARWNPTEFNDVYGVTIGSGFFGDSFNSYYGVVADLTYLSYFSTDEESDCGSYSEVDPAEFNDYYGIIVGMEDSLWVNEEYDPSYGVTAAVEGYTVVGDYGLATCTQNMATDTPYGILTGLSDNPRSVYIYYLKTPAAVRSAADELEISQIFDRAIKFYVTAMALRDDRDSQNRQLGAEELNFFIAELEDAKKDSALNYTDTPTRYSTQYVGAFD